MFVLKSRSVLVKYKIFIGIEKGIGQDFAKGQDFATWHRTLPHGIEKGIGQGQQNQDAVQFLRNLDTTSLQHLAQKSQDTVKLYQTFCDLITDLDLRTNNDSVLPYKRFVKTVSKHKLSEALSVCTSLNAVLPEIHDKQDFTKLREYAFLNNIYNIPSGLTFDATTRNIRFKSNHKKC